jgi:hypothetical protein
MNFCNDERSERFQWFYVDMPCLAGDHSERGLEIGVLRPSRDFHPRDTDARLLSARASGIVSKVVYRDFSYAMSPELFLGNVVPEFFPEAMAVGTARAAELLRRVVDDGARRAPPWLLRWELRETYRSLLPDRARRSMALEWHARWLEIISGTTRDPKLEAALLVESTTEVRYHPKLSDDYWLLQRRMTGEWAAFEREFEHAMEAIPEEGELAASLIARLTHIQAVRLRGPDDPVLMQLEIAILRDLQAECG